MSYEKFSRWGEQIDKREPVLAGDALHRRGVEHQVGIRFFAVRDVAAGG